MTKTWVTVCLILLLSVPTVLACATATAEIPKTPSGKSPVPGAKGHFKTKLGFGVWLPRWLPHHSFDANTPKVQKELTRIIDEMWVRFQKKFKTDHLDPKKITIYIHERMGSFEWPHLAGRYRGLSWIEENKIIAAWSVNGRTNDVDFKKSLEILYHEWAHFLKPGPDPDHKDKRWKIAHSIKPVSWGIDYLPMPPLFIEFRINRPAGRRSDLPPSKTTR